MDISNFASACRDLAGLIFTEEPKIEKAYVKN